jgi:hypothetical protein
VRIGAAIVPTGPANSCPGRPADEQWRPVTPRDLFEILTREHIDSVRAFLLASLRDGTAFDDLLQETFLVAWRLAGLIGAQRESTSRTVSAGSVDYRRPW